MVFAKRALMSVQGKRVVYAACLFGRGSMEISVIQRTPRDVYLQILRSKGGKTTARRYGKQFCKLGHQRAEKHSLRNMDVNFSFTLPACAGSNGGNSGKVMNQRKFQTAFKPQPCAPMRSNNMCEPLGATFEVLC